MKENVKKVIFYDCKQTRFSFCFTQNLKNNHFLYNVKITSFNPKQLTNRPYINPYSLMYKRKMIAIVILNLFRFVETSH